MLIRLRADGRSVPELESRGNGRRESGRVGLFEGARGEERETTWLNSREYHKASSSSSSSLTSLTSASNPGTGEKGTRVNSKVSSVFSSEAKGDGEEDLMSMRGCFEMRGRATAILSEGERRAGNSSSEAPGVVGISVLEQADMLVREGVGERDRGGERRSKSRGRGGVLGSAGVSLTGEAGSDAEMSMIISNALRRTDCRIGLVDDDEDRSRGDDGGCGAARGGALRKSSVRANAPNWSLP